MSKLDDIIAGTVPQDADIREALTDLNAKVEAIREVVAALAIPAATETLTIVEEAQLIQDALKAAGYTGPITVRVP